MSDDAAIPHYWMSATANAIKYSCGCGSWLELQRDGQWEARKYRCQKHQDGDPVGVDGRGY